MRPDVSDLLQSFLAQADAGDLLELVDFLAARARMPVLPLRRYALAGELGFVLSRAIRQGDVAGWVCKRLTGREVEILRLVAAGLSNQGVAEALGIKERTVRQHVENMQNKLNVSGRGRLVAVAFGLGD